MKAQKRADCVIVTDNTATGGNSNGQQGRQSEYNVLITARICLQKTSLYQSLKGHANHKKHA